VNWLTWRQRVVLRDGLPYVEFVTEVDWDTHSRRLRIAFPTRVRTDVGDYEIPYGTLRRARYDTCTYVPNGVNGDWPAVHWAGPASAAGSVAVINRGECSYRVEGGNVLVSLLRSPDTPWCAYEPQFYRMPLFDGMRDAGRHSFSLAVYPFRGPWNESDVTRQAWSYTRQ
jgi:alpha-mannosidase